MGFVKIVKQKLPQHLTNDEICVTLDRMKSDKGYNPCHWPDWLIANLQEWFAERSEDD